MVDGVVVDRGGTNVATAAVEEVRTSAASSQSQWAGGGEQSVAGLVVVGIGQLGLEA